MKKSAKRKSSKNIYGESHQSIPIPRLLENSLPTPPTSHDTMLEVIVKEPASQHVFLRAVTEGNDYPLYIDLYHSSTGFRVSSGFVNEKIPNASQTPHYFAPFSVEIENGDIRLNGLSLSSLDIDSETTIRFLQVSHQRIRQIVYAMNVIVPNYRKAKGSPNMYYETAGAKLEELLRTISPEGTVDRRFLLDQPLETARRIEIPANEYDLDEVHGIRRKVKPSAKERFQGSTLLEPNTTRSFMSGIYSLDYQARQTIRGTRAAAVINWILDMERGMHDPPTPSPEYQAEQRRLTSNKGESFATEEPGTVFAEPRNLLPSSFGKRSRPRNTHPIWHNLDTKPLHAA